MSNDGHFHEETAKSVISPDIENVCFYLFRIKAD